MKADRIMLIVLLVLVIGIIVIQLVVKQKVVLDDGTTGTSSVFGKKSLPAPSDDTEE